MRHSVISTNVSLSQQPDPSNSSLWRSLGRSLKLPNTTNTSSSSRSATPSNKLDAYVQKNTYKHSNLFFVHWLVQYGIRTYLFTDTPTTVYSLITNSLRRYALCLESSTLSLLRTIRKPASKPRDTTRQFSPTFDITSRNTKRIGIPSHNH